MDSDARESSRPAHDGTSISPVPVPSSPPFYDDESNSSVIDVSSRTVGGYLTEQDSAVLREPIARIGLLLRPESAPERVDAMVSRPAFAIVDMALPDAERVLLRLCSEPKTALAVAFTEDGAGDARALAAGARATLHRPPSPAALCTVLTRLRDEHREKRRRADVFARAEGNAASEAMGRFAATVAHEIRNALTAASGNVALLLESDYEVSASERRAALTDASTALASIGHVLDALGGLASGRAPSLGIVDLRAVAHEAVASARVAHRAARADVEVLAPSRVVARANRTMLLRVVTNLVENAFHATHGVDSPRVVVRVYETSDEARISVRDNGPGVPAALREVIFEPLFTTRQSTGGSGLGLAIARGAMVAMGGALTLSGQAPPGACFRVRLRRV